MNNFDEIAGMHLITKGMETPNKYGNDILRQQLGKLGVGLVIIGGNSGAYDKVDQGIILAHPTIDIADGQMQLGAVQEFQLGRGGVEVERTKVNLLNIEDKIPVINGPRLRGLDDKWEQYQLINEFSPKTVIVRPNESPTEESFYNLSGNLFVVKGNLSQASKHIKVCARSEVRSAIAGMRDEFETENAASGKLRKNSDIIVQEYVPGQNWSELKAVDDDSGEILAGAKETELRVYCFVDREGKIPFDKRYHATVRAFDNNHDDEWACLDQESVPVEVWQISEVVSNRLLSKADVPGGFFAIDYIKSDVNDGLGERIFIREINMSNPVMVGEKDSKKEATIQRALLANLMKTLTNSNRLVTSK